MIPLFKVFMSGEAKANALEVMSSGHIAQGPKVDEFEAKLKEYLQSPVDLLTVNSCTTALEMALYLAGVGPGDEVITTAQTCTATNQSIVRAGATPAFADIDPTTGNIDPASVANCMSDDTAAVMAVDWGGSTCDYDGLRDVAHLSSGPIPIIEDAAHAFGSFIRSNGSGARLIAAHGGDYVAWSFQAIKHLTTGDGGLLRVPVTQIERARLYRWYGLDRRSTKSFRCEQNIQELGIKGHMNDIAAAIGLGNLIHMKYNLYLIHENARFYVKSLKDLPGIDVHFDPLSSYWLFTIMVDDRKSFERFVRERGVFECSQVHVRNDTYDAFKQVAVCDRVPLPGLEYFSQHMVCIPVHWAVTATDRERIVEEIRTWSKMTH